MATRLLCGAVAAVLLTGCSSEAGQPRSLPPVDTTPNSTPRAPATAAVPTSAQASTPQAAAQFARFFYAEVERAYREKDPEIVRRLSAPGCVACSRFLESLTAIRDKGETVTPVVYEIVSAEAPAISGREARVDVIYNSPAITRRDRTDAVIAREPGVKNFEEQVTLVRGGSGWLVRAVKAV